MEASLNESIELLTTDDDGNAVEGPKYPVDLGVVKYLAAGDEYEFSNARVAYPHKFFKRDKHGQPIEGTLVRFLVPDYLCDGANPNSAALRLVAQRMGWTDDD